MTKKYNTLFKGQLVEAQVGIGKIYVKPDGTIVGWPCGSCGVTLSGRPRKFDPTNSGLGIRLIPGFATKEEIISDKLNVRALKTKAGSITIITGHV